MNELRPLLVVIAGPMGAGKTTFYNAHLKEAFPLSVPPVRHQREAMLREHRSFAVEDLVASACPRARVSIAIDAQALPPYAECRQPLC